MLESCSGKFALRQNPVSCWPASCVVRQRLYTHVKLQTGQQTDKNRANGEERMKTEQLNAYSSGQGVKQLKT